MYHHVTFSLIDDQGEVILRAEALNADQATQFIRDAVKFGGIDLSRHARMQMKERSFDLNDVLLVLSNGKVTDAPEFDEEHQDFKYLVTGPTLDEDQATVVVVLPDHRTVYVVTIFCSGEMP